MCPYFLVSTFNRFLFNLIYMATANENDYYEVIMLDQTMRVYDITNARVACDNLTIKLLLVYVYMCMCTCAHVSCVQENT